MVGNVRAFGELFLEAPRNGLTRPKAVRGVGVKMVNMGELFAHSRIKNALMDRVLLSDSEADRFLLHQGDLLFARQSLVLEGAGKCSIFLEDVEPATFESHVTRIRLDPSKANPLFYYYYLQSHEGKTTIRSIVEQGAGASGIRGSDLARLGVLWRPLDEQSSVASVLGTLDDKIEANRRISRTLERMARAVFRAWFVDFEPVRAKAAGARSFPGMPQGAFDALPIRLVELSGFGPVPEGWEVACIGDVVSVRGGGTPSTKVEEFWENGTNCWLTPRDLSGMKDGILLSTARKITDKGLGKISSGLLPVGTVLLSSRAPVGYLVLSGVPTAINQGFIAMVCDGTLPPLYVYHWTQTVMDEIKSRASGTTFPEISKSAFRPIKVCVPTTEPVLESFTATIEPLFEKLTTIIRESLSLERLRDYLLPKLLSGAVQVGLSPEVVADKGDIKSNEEAGNVQ